MHVARRWFNCPKCRSTKTARSRVRWYQAWRAALTGRQPYRCFDCGRKFWKKPVDTDPWQADVEQKS
jgi:hypothetical protein